MIKRDIDLMLKFNLSSEELFFIKLIWIASQEGGSQHLYRYYYERQIKHGIKPGVDKNMVNGLLDKGILSGDYITDKDIIEYDGLTLNESSEFFIAIYPHGYEFWDEYPAFTQNLEGKKYPIKNISKTFATVEDFLAFYGQTIQYDIEKHKKNMKALKRAMDQNLVNFSIYEWVVSKKWEEFKEDEDLIVKDERI